MLILGIDQSADSNGVCWTNGDLYCPSIYRLKGRGGERLCTFAEWFLEASSGCDLVVMEQPISYGSSNSRAGATMVIHRIAGILEMLCHKEKIPLIAIHPAHLKQWAFGKGNASKTQMIECAEKRWQITIPKDDMADALFLSEIGRHYLKKESTGNTLKDSILHSL